MLETAELRQKIRQVLEDVVPTGPETVERALDRIKAVDAFEQAAREELQRFRETFAEWSNDRTTVATPNPTDKSGPAFHNALISKLDLCKSHADDDNIMKHDSVRTSLDIPEALHRKLHEAARRRGCSVRQLILGYMERWVAEELPHEPHRVRLPVRLPLVRAACRGTVADVTNDEALFG